MGKVSHLAHLSGLVIGYVFFWMVWPQALAGFIPWRWPRKRFRVVTPESEVDSILDKISRKGMASLTRQEREILDRASRQPDRNN